MFLVNADHCVIAVAQTVSIFRQYFTIGRNVEKKYTGTNEFLFSSFIEGDDLRRVITHEVVCAAHFCGTTQLGQAVGDKACTIHS